MERAKDVSTLRKIDERGMTREQISEKIDAALRLAKPNTDDLSIKELKARKLHVKEIERLRAEGKKLTH